MVKKKDYIQKQIQTFALKDKPLTVYKSGNSNVITIPSYLNIKPGDKILIRKIKKITTEKERIEKNLIKIEELSGKYNLNTGNMNAEELDIELEGVYE